MSWPTMPTLAFLENVGGPELLMLMIVALLLFGKKLPEVSRNLGKGLAQFKKGLTEVDQQVQQSPQLTAPRISGATTTAAPPALPAQPSTASAPPAPAQAAAAPTASADQVGPASNTAENPSDPQKS